MLLIVDGWNVLVSIFGSAEMDERGLTVGGKVATGFFVMISALGDTVGVIVLIDGPGVFFGDCVGELLIDGQGVTIGYIVDDWNVLVAIVGSIEINGRGLIAGGKGATSFFVIISALGVSEDQQQVFN